MYLIYADSGLISCPNVIAVRPIDTTCCRIQQNGLRFTTVRFITIHIYEVKYKQ